MQGVKHKNIDPTYWKTALFFLSSSNPKKVNGAMNTNINNKKFKLVPLRNQSMQAFACKRECDKEALGDDEDGEGGRKRGQREGADDVEAFGGRVEGEKKNHDDPSSDSFSF